MCWRIVACGGGSLRAELNAIQPANWTFSMHRAIDLTIFREAGCGVGVSWGRRGSRSMDGSTSCRRISTRSLGKCRTLGLREGTQAAGLHSGDFAHVTWHRYSLVLWD